MAKGYSKDLRERVVAIVEEGDSAREAARLLNVGASTAIRWIERWTTTGSVEAKPGTGHSRSPLNKHEQWLLDLVAAEPDLTLDDIRLRLSGAKKLKVGTSSIWRFYDRHEITFKKTLHAAEQDRPDVAAARAELKASSLLLRRRAWCSLTRPRSRRKWSVTTVAVRAASGWSRACHMVAGRR